MTLSIIVAMTPGRAIGYRNRLPWHIAEDLHRFRRLTTGHTVVMGRHTFESLPHGALPERRNIVVSRTMSRLDGCEVYASVDEALHACETDDEVFVIGGGSIYTRLLPVAQRLYLTWVEQEPMQADTYFPMIDWEQWEITKKEKHDGFSFIDMVRKSGVGR